MKKFVTFIISLLVMTLIATGCVNQTPNYNTTPSGFVLDPGITCEITGYLVYEVIEYDGAMVSIIDEAETLVKQWWNNDSTFHKPTIVWCNILYSDVRGFQDTGYIFLDPNTSKDDLLATVVHEWLHDLVDKQTLVSEEGVGRAIMEMIVEAITVDILKEIATVEPTENYLYFISNDTLLTHKSELILAFRQSKDFSAYKDIFGDDYLQIVFEAERLLGI